MAANGCALIGWSSLGQLANQRPTCLCPWIDRSLRRLNGSKWPLDSDLSTCWPNCGHENWPSSVYTNSSTLSWIILAFRACFFRLSDTKHLCVNDLLMAMERYKLEAFIMLALSYWRSLSLQSTCLKIAWYIVRKSDHSTRVFQQTLLNFAVRNDQINIFLVIMKNWQLHLCFNFAFQYRKKN